MHGVGTGSWACLLSWAIAHFGNYVILLWHEALECALFIGRSLGKTYQGKASVGAQRTGAWTSQGSFRIKTVYGTLMQKATG